MRRLLRWATDRQDGQTMVVLAMAMVVLLGIAGLVVDVGNAYALQRKVRNAVDSAALAGAGELAKQGSTTNANVLTAVRRYFALNAMPTENVEAWYCDLSGNPLQLVNNDSFSPPVEVDGNLVAGVLVRGGDQVSTYLAQLVGVDSFSSVESSMGWVSCGTCAASNLFPAAISLHTFSATNGVPVIGQSYTFWGDMNAPGNFGWLSWDGSPSTPTLAANISDPSRSGMYGVGDWIQTGPGVEAASSVSTNLQALIDQGKNEVTLPVYSVVTGSGANAAYQVAGFVRVKLTGYKLTGRDKYLSGEFLRWVDGEGEGGCADLGVCAVKLRQPMIEERAIAGVVSIWEPRLTENIRPQTEHLPVDVVNVLDISGSMNDRWGTGGGEVKLTTAKRVLQEFNQYLLPDEGDRVGLVTFPQVSSGSYYSMPCGSSRSRTYYLARIAASLTSNVASVNTIIAGLSATGGTPLASGLQSGRQVVLPDTVPTEGRVPVIIVASDGIANCTVEGRWTGFSGNDSNSPTCNAIAEQHAIEQADMAKEAGVIIFTIAIGDDFNTSVLQAMASQDTDPTKPHFFLAQGETSLEEVYRSIAVRVNNIGSECEVDEFESSGDSAIVSLLKDGALYDQTTASATGSYVFTDVEPGLYTFDVTMLKNGLTFDILTDVIGGPESESLPTLQVGEAAGTYIRDLYLRTSTPLLCQ